VGGGDGQSLEVRDALLESLVLKFGRNRFPGKRNDLAD
jgi:hypothetical protein